ncbi:MAG: hypothetical protein PWR30_348 [Candidatus Woesearchaeota archaeon]|nr:hypothetical protein [Candidatus Woesearchaeota archaeon]
MLSIVFVEPENPGNLGACARVMANFGFSSLLIINPKFQMSDPEILERSKHGFSVIENSNVVRIDEKKILPFLKEAFDYVVGTTAKLGNDFNIVRSPLSVEEFATILDERFKDFKDASKPKIALLIGREGDGLTNEELEQCDFVLTIPANPSYPTLNVSHALGIILYELFKISKEKSSSSHLTLATHEEKEFLMKRFSQLLDELNFDSEKKKTQELLFNRIISRSFFKKREVFIIHGFISKALDSLGKNNSKGKTKSTMGKQAMNSTEKE